ncbi:MAG TPA: PLP-dependent transferase, partial [Rectinemataceae bacterium]|nr:PLP-dependent transferase [Rectinemataceae bacterium]
PIFCNPIDFGVDLVVHSASKYLGGHSDLVAGVIVGSAADIDRIQQQEFMQLGTVADPFMAWLLLRGMRTLQPRMAAHRTGALAVARHLEAHPAVESVLYPMLESHPDHELALRQMRGGSGLLSFRLKGGDIGKVERLTDALRLFKRAVSWGGYESLVFPYAAGRAASADRVGLVRLHVGLEDSDELIVDLDRALAAAR